MLAVRKRSAALAAGVLLVGASAAAWLQLNRPLEQLSPSGVDSASNTTAIPCANVMDLCRALESLRILGEQRKQPFSLLPYPTPLLKAGTLPPFYIRLDGHHYPIDMSQAAPLFMLRGTFSVRSTPMTNCRRSDDQPQVIDATWYLFYGTQFKIVYQIQSIALQYPRTASGRYVLDVKTSHGLMVCDGEVTLGPSPDDRIMQDGFEAVPAR